jgi:hypothetical protein
MQRLEVCHNTLQHDNLCRLERRTTRTRSRCRRGADAISARRWRLGVDQALVERVPRFKSDFRAWFALGFWFPPFVYCTALVTL